MTEQLDFHKLLDRLEPHERLQFFNSLGLQNAEAVDGDWSNWAHDGQKCPSGDWRTWVIMAGRGFGKTRAGAEWVAGLVDGRPDLRIALVGATIDEARRVMVDGESGLLNVASDLVDRYYPTRRLLLFKNGAEATLFSGASPEALRGPEHHFAWCDELAKWEKPGETWDMLQLGLRLGERPRVLVTTTPKPGPDLARIMAAKGCVVTHGKTRANPHLPAAFVETVEELYAGTRLGRQELDGELLPDVAGALWSVELLERCRFISSTLLTNPFVSSAVETPIGHARLHGISTGLDANGEGNDAVFDPFVSSAVETPIGHRPPPLTRTLIGVDPPSGDGTCGIIACALDEDGIAYVLADHSVTARSPEGWARAVAAAAEVHNAQLVVAETNQGGAMVEAVLKAADARLRVKAVQASMSKSDRATPIAARFEAGKVRLCGRFEELEAQLCGMIAGGGYEGPGRSPDRADAMVWALSELMLGKEMAVPRVSVL
jgi:phage terminase large subunit-like protein